MPQKSAGSSQAAWALLAEGVASARIEAHRLRNIISRALHLVEVSSTKAHIYEIAGDIILSVPKRLEALESDLDRTSYALSVLGSDSLREQLPLSDRKVVDEAVERAKPIFGPWRVRSSARVAKNFLRQADLTPPLGYPGGPCHVIDRIRQVVRQPGTQQRLVDEVEEGDDLSNSDAARVYHPFVEHGPPGPYKQIVIHPHTQYRMDGRGITIPAVRATLASFVQHLNALKSRGPLHSRSLEESIAWDKVVWTDPKIGLTVVFRVQGKDIHLVTTYWKGEADPRPPGDGGCDE